MIAHFQMKVVTMGVEDEERGVGGPSLGYTDVSVKMWREKKELRRLS